MSLYEIILVIFLTCFMVLAIWFIWDAGNYYDQEYDYYEWWYVRKPKEDIEIKKLISKLNRQRILHKN